jgi:hypothetical protein
MMPLDRPDLGMHTEPIQQLWPQFPSSGLPEPTKMNRAGWLIEILPVLQYSILRLRNLINIDQMII